MAKLSSSLGVLAVLFASVAFVLGSAPFTPALTLVFAAIPLAVVSAFIGSWRLALVAVYLSVVVWTSVPLANELSLRIDYLLLLSGMLGALLGAVLYYGHSRHVHVF